MPNVICPACGAKYASEKVANLAKFKCAACGAIVAGGRAAPPLPVAEPVSDAPPPRRSHAPRTSHASAAPAKKGGVPPAVWIGVGAAALLAVGAVVAMSGKAEPAPDGAGAVASVPAASAAAEPAKADPMKDVSAWKALPEAERARLAQGYVASADISSADSVQRAAEFLTSRGETASVPAIAKRVVGRDPGNAWARTTLGHTEVGAEVDRCIAECEQADEESDPKYAALKAERARHAGAWWTDEAETQRVRALVAEVRAVEKGYDDPYTAGVEKWVRRHRAVDIMKDNPALHAAVGPYVIFVSLNVPRSDKPGGAKDVTMADVPKEELARGEKILERNKKVFAALYEGWMTEIAPHFGMTRYGPENSDFKLLMKANVFAKPEDFMAYNIKSGAGIGGFTRAYYSAEEPRFITTYDGGEDEDDAYADQVQCHEATHQLVHFYTWDLTRKELGREPDWLEVHRRPLWSGEGFAEFFSSHAVVDGKYRWMQPLDERMRQIWIFEEMAKEKGWIPWRLKEFFFTLHHGGTLSALSRARATKNGDEGIAEGVMANLFYGKAWSFVHFLWYAEAGGKPKYRDRYIKYLDSEFHVKFVRDPGGGKDRPAPVGSDALMRCLGISSDDELVALEKEWNEYTAKLLAANRKPEWDAERTKIRTNFGFEKPAGKKDPHGK